MNRILLFVLLGTIALIGANLMRKCESVAMGATGGATSRGGTSTAGGTSSKGGTSSTGGTTAAAGTCNCTSPPPGLCVPSIGWVNVLQPVHASPSASLPVCREMLDR
jgi:hypothetical protein